MTERQRIRNVCDKDEQRRGKGFSAPAQCSCSCNSDVELRLLQPRAKRCHPHWDKNNDLTLRSQRLTSYPLNRAPAAVNSWAHFDFINFSALTNISTQFTWIWLSDSSCRVCVEFSCVISLIWSLWLYITPDQNPKEHADSNRPAISEAFSQGWAKCSTFTQTQHNP